MTDNERRLPVLNVAGAAMSRRALLRRTAFATAAIGLTAACGGGSSSPAAGTASTQSTSSTTTGATSASPGTSGGTTRASGSPASGSTSTGSASPATGAKTAFNVVPAANKGGKLVEGFISDAKTLSPTIESDTASGAIISMMFDSLMTVDPSNTQPAPGLAQKWDIASDGVTYTFTLHDGVTFHDGQPLTANDVKFSYDLMMNKASNSPRTSELTERIKSVDVKDPKTIVFTLNHPTAPFLVSNCEYGIVPQHALQNEDPAHLAQSDFATGKKGVTIGTGPFMFEEWVRGDHITVSKYAKYWRGEPNLDQYIYKVVPSQAVMADQLKTGELDFGSVQPADVQTMQQQKNVNVVPYDAFAFTFYAYQLDPAKTDLFQDKAVRQALLYALDRKAMIEAILFGQGVVAIGTEPTISWAYAPDQIQNKYPYDMNKAKQLLDQAGWKAGSDGILAKNGKKLQFSVYTNAGNDVREQYITVFQQQWGKLGVTATPKTEDFTAFLDRIEKTHDFEIFLVGFSWDVDPDQQTMWASDAYNGGFNMNKYSNPQVDQIVSQALQETDQNKRKQLYIQMQNIVLDDLPSAILDFPKSIAVVNKRVHNLFPNAVDSRFNSYQWWVDS